jgi:hypothetical protein
MKMILIMRRGYRGNAAVRKQQRRGACLPSTERLGTQESTLVNTEEKAEDMINVVAIMSVPCDNCLSFRPVFKA